MSTGSVEERTKRSLKRSMTDNICDDPGFFGRSLRSRDHMERFHQDTGFYGLHLGWELGTSPDISPLQSHGHQWRLRRSDMGALDFPKPFASKLNRTLISPEPSTDAENVSSSGIPGLTTDADPKLCQKNEIEIAPGVYSPLRSAAETFKAIENDFYVRLTCENCNKPIFCIQNAKHVLCPHCRQVSFMDSCGEDAYGVGMGFSIEFLVCSQMQRRGSELCMLETRK